jgi:N-acetyl-gamma-glutamyl-phosphate reductase
VRLDRAALVFSALPHGASAEWVARARTAGARVVDLSADLRIGNGASDGVPYGLTELRRAQVRGAACVSNPGCYPTSALIALAPLFEQGLVAPGAVVNISAASGVSGAGLSPRVDLLFGDTVDIPLCGCLWLALDQGHSILALAHQKQWTGPRARGRPIERNWPA